MSGEGSQHRRQSIPLLVKEKATRNPEMVKYIGPDDVLAQLVAEAVQHGADELDIEYRDRCEQVSVMKNGAGFGIASLGSSSEEACILREQLSAIGKAGAAISVGGTTFRLQVSAYDTFGEDAYRVRIQRRPTNKERQLAVDDAMLRR